MYQLFTINLAAAKVRREQLEGRDHLVVPAAMLAEGAWTGEYGTFMYPAAELKKSVSLWDHKPVVVYHPKKDGQAVSACDPAVINTQKVGVILNTRFDEKAKKLRAEVWIDEARCKEIDPRVLDAVNKKQLSEVSTGLTMMSDETEGEWVHNVSGKEKKKKFQGTASDYQPDHLAILPDQIGAFKVADGGGLLQVNTSGEVIGSLTTVVEAARQAASRGPRALKKYLRSVFAANALSFSDIRQKLYELLAAAYGEKGKSWYGDIVDIFPDYCVFCTYGEGRTGVMYRQDYTTTGDVVALSGEAVQVQRATEYVAVNAAGERHQENSVEKKVMIDALIANSDGVYTEADRPDLDKWEVPRLTKAHAKYEKKVEQQNTAPPKEEQKITLSKAEYDALMAKTVQQQNTTPPKMEEYLSSLPAPAAKQFKKLLDRDEAERKFLVNKVKEKAPKLNEAYLNGLEIEELEGLAELAGVSVQQQNGRVPMFVGNAGGRADNTPDPDPETGLDMETTDWKAVSQRNNSMGRRLDNDD
jgi:hypothetical protein